jgi:hypothetical protein
VLYLLSPALLGGFLGSLRGYAGEVNAVQALEAVNADGNAVIIDIRSQVRAGARWGQGPGGGRGQVGAGARWGQGPGGGRGQAGAGARRGGCWVCIQCSQR